MSDLTMCEGCNKDVVMDETAACQYCGFDPLCDECRHPDFHECWGKPGEPGTLTLEVGQRVHDRFERPPQSVGRIADVTKDKVVVYWKEPTTKFAEIPRNQAEHLLTDSNLDWDTLKPV